MIAVDLTSPVVAAHLHRAVDYYVGSHQLRGTIDTIPPAILELRDLLASIRERSQSLRSTAVDDGSHGPHHALMTRTEAAAILGCSPSTVTRFTNAGRLVKVGRRITAASVHALANGAPICPGLEADLPSRAHLRRPPGTRQPRPPGPGRSSGPGANRPPRKDPHQ